MSLKTYLHSYNDCNVEILMEEKGFQESNADHAHWKFVRDIPVAVTDAVLLTCDNHPVQLGLVKLVGIRDLAGGSKMPGLYRSFFLESLPVIIDRRMHTRRLIIIGLTKIIRSWSNLRTKQ